MEKGERKKGCEIVKLINKIIICTATIIVYICTVIVVNV